MSEQTDPGRFLEPRICRGKCVAPWQITRREGGPDALIVMGNGYLLLYASADREGMMTRGGASADPAGAPCHQNSKRS